MSASYAVASYGGAPSATEQSTVTTTTGQGDAILVLVGAGTTGAPSGVPVDSKGNTYTLLKSDTTQVNCYAYLGYASTPLVAGTDWIKVSFAGAAAGQQWIARGMAGVQASGAADITISTSSPGSGSPAATSAQLAQGQEWAVALLANGNGGGAPATWTGGFTAQQTVHSGTGTYCTVADQVTNSVNPLTAGASITSAKWALIVVTLRFAPVYLIGSADAAAGSATLTVPVTTPSRPGNLLFATGQVAVGAGGLTAVTDSTNANIYTQQKNNGASGFSISSWTAQGKMQLGAAYSGGSYSDVTTSLGAAQELDTWLNGGAWPTQKLTPRTMAFNVARQYYGSDTGGDGKWPTDAAHDTQGLAGLASMGVKNVCITFRPARDATNNYTGSTFTAEYNSLVSSLAYVKTVFPNIKVTLWHEANIDGIHGPFGDGTQYKGGSPYGTGAVGSVSLSQMHANWQAYVNFYGPAIHAAAVDFFWMPSMASPNEAIDFFDIALNATQQSWYTGVGCDYYCSDGVNAPNGPPQIKTGIEDPYLYGTNNISMMGLARKYSTAFSIWELGNHGGPTAAPTANMVFFLEQVVGPAFYNRLANGQPCGEILLFNYGGNAISGSTDPAVIAAFQNVYDLLNGTTAALPAGASVTLTYGTTTGVKQGAVVGVTSASSATADKAVVGSGNSTAPSVATGVLSQPAEVVIAYAENSHGAGPLTWAAGWTPLVSDVNGSSPYFSVAYQIVNSTAAVTASGTVSVAGAWSMNADTFPLSIATLGSGLVVPKPALSGAGAVAVSLSGTGGLTVPKPGLASGGVGAPGTPYLAGSASAASGPLTIAVSTSVSAGDTVQVGVTVAGTSVPTVGPDTAGNTYALVLSDTVNTGAQLYVFESDGSNPLTQGFDSIPVTQTGAGLIGAIAVGDNGVIGPDKAVIAHGTSAAPASPTTGVLGQAEEHAIAWVVDAEAGGAPAWASPWSADVLATVDVAATVKISAAYQIVAATTALTAQAAITSAAWAAACVTTKVAPIQALNVPTNGILGIPYFQRLESSGGEPPVSWAVTTGPLPPGLALSGGVISGVPTAAGAYPVTFTLTDGLGQTATLAVTVTVVGGAAGAAPMGATANNLLSAADSDFETGGFTWASASNASAPAQTRAVALTGSAALYWTSQQDGPTSIAPAAVPVTAGAPYIASGAILPAGTGTAALGVTWLDAQGNTLGTGTAAAVSVTGGTWAPLTGTFTAPTGAVFGVLTVTVQDSNAGDINVIDMMYFAQSPAQVLVDWVNPTFARGGNAGGAFMDVSPWLRLDGNGVTYTRGRQDAISEIQPGSGAFSLQNDVGHFARDSSVSIPAALGGAMTLKCRAQLNFADEHGAWWTRFDGNISEIGYDLDNTGNTSVAQIALTDVLADLSKQDPLFCWTKEQALADSPQYHWSLDDPGTAGGAGVAAETSGNNGPPMRLLNSDSAKTATIAWQDTSGGVETLADAASATGADGAAYWVAGSNQPVTPLRGLVSGNVGPFTAPIGSVLLTPAAMTTSPWATSTQTAQNTFLGNAGYMLQAALPIPLAPTAIGSDYSIECWFMPDASIAGNLGSNYGPFVAFGLGSSRNYANLLAGLFLAAGSLTIECAAYSQPPAFKGRNWAGSAAPVPTASTSGAFTADTVKRPHHLVVTISGDPTAAGVTLWVDGNVVGSFTLPAGQSYDTITIGGAYGGSGAWLGNLSLASIYPYALAPQQITQHCQLGQYGMWETTTDDAIAQLGQYAAIPGFWAGLSAQHAGLTLAEYLNVAGTNALAAMQQYESAEKGLLFVNASGALTYHTRAWRMGYRGPDLYLPPGVFDAALSYKAVDQFLVNEEAIAGPNTLGATATTLLASAAGQTQTQTTTSAVIQAGYVNTASQRKYGVYASNPVSAPLSLPLITWSRGYAALGLAPYSFWADPGLSDRAAWDANSRGEPWALPASLSIDLLTLDPTSGLGISSFYGVEIDNMLAPSPATLPPSLPNAQTSVEWFVEGVTETMTSTSRVIGFYTSPAEPQRAWIPGDPTYGVLGSTTRLGISGTDTSVPQAYGKDVSHDAGGPYWPPAFTSSLNAPPAQSGANPPFSQTLGGTGSGFVGAADLRGIAVNLQTMLAPPLCVVAALGQAQAVPAGSLAAPQVFWDTVFADTTGGMGAMPGWPNWYLVTVAGYYEIDLSLPFAATGSVGGYTGQAWIIVAQAAAQALASGAATPLTVDQYVCPLGEAVRFNSSSVTPTCAASTRMYLGVGDMVCIGAEQNTTGSVNTAIAKTGPIMSLRFAGLGQTDDRTLINTSLANGGTVSLTSHGPVQSATFFNTRTYAYQGEKGFTKNGRRNTNLGCYQGQKPGFTSEGSQASQIAFSAASISSALAGHTVLSATLSATNIQTGYPTGAKLMLGWTKDTPGGITWDADGSNSTANVLHQTFTTGQVLTFSIPVSLVTAFLTKGAQALTIGDGDTTDQNYYGEWQGGPGAWTLGVTYS